MAELFPFETRLKDGTTVRIRLLKPDDREDPQSVLFRIWERDEVRSALQQVPRHFAEIIVLRDIEGLSYKELAELLECPVGTVMSRLARARARFKQVLCSRRAEPAGLNIDKQ